MAKKLATYRAKRDFTRTAEPEGEARIASSPYLRFVIQKHAARRLHYDLRLELDGVLKSWAVTRGPSLDPADKRLSVEVEDHPIDYGDFEETIPQGEYGGGTVMIWDRGFWVPEGLDAPDVRAIERALRKGELKLVLAGEKLKGGFVLVKLKHDKTRSMRTDWLLINHWGAHAREGEWNSMPCRTAYSNQHADWTAYSNHHGDWTAALHALQTAGELSDSVQRAWL